MLMAVLTLSIAVLLLLLGCSGRVRCAAGSAPLVAAVFRGRLCLSIVGLKMSLSLGLVVLVSVWPISMLNSCCSDVFGVPCIDSTGIAEPT